MGTTFVTNAGQLAARKRLLADRTQANFAKAGNLMGAALKAEARRLSSGTVSAAQLRRRGHPYARRLPVNSAMTADYVINAQTGVFRDSWHFRARRTARGWTIDLWNDSQTGKFMLGTALMRSRPILEEVMRRTAPVLPQAVAAAVRLTVRESGGYSAPLPAWAGALYAAGVGAASAAGALEGSLG